MEEIWKELPDYEGLYMVSNFGRIKTMYRIYYTGGNNNAKRVQEEKIMKPYSTGRYLDIDLRKDGGSKKCRLHRLVALLFCENPNNYKEVNHIDGDRLNNSASNLEWCTRSYNQKHAYDNNLQKKRYGNELSWSKCVLNTQNGIFYETISEAANSIGISVTSLSRYLNGIRKNKTSFVFA